MLTETMHDHHQECDDRFAAAEAAIARQDWQTGGNQFAAFATALEAHFGAEEELLFPAFENATGMVSGPTQVMRLEHRQMRGLVDAMRQALAAHDGEAFAGAAQTLLIMMQQHNMKEENILYPMIDRALAPSASELSTLLAERLGAAHPV